MPEKLQLVRGLKPAFQGIYIDIVNKLRFRDIKLIAEMPDSSYGYICRHKSKRDIF